MYMKPRNRREFLKVTFSAAGALALPDTTRAQAIYPSRAIKLICPWPAGGTTDAIMRAFAASVAKTLGATIVVENKPGASGTFGAIELANAKPDGYTLSQLPIGIFRLPHMQKVSFNPLTDLTYIAALTGYIMGFVVRSDSPIKSIKDLIEYAKANPGKFTYSSVGTGSTPHLVVEQFCRRAGIEMLHIPHKGSADGLQAVLGGHVMGHSDTTGWGSHVDAGRCRLLALYGSKRAKRWPTIPTLKELGYDIVSDSPFGVGGPKGMDPLLVKRLHDAFKKALDEPEVKATLEKYDQPTIYLNSADYTKLAQDTYQEEGNLIRTLNLGR